MCKEKLNIVAKAMLAIALCLTGFVAKAQSDALLLTLNDDTKVAFALAEKPVLTFEGSDLVFTPAELAPMSYDMGTIKDITFGDYTGIDGVKADVVITPSEGAISVSGLAAGAMLRVFSINGQEVCAAKADASGVATVSTAHLAPGTYVAQAGSYTWKFIK